MLEKPYTGNYAIEMSIELLLLLLRTRFTYDISVLWSSQGDTPRISRLSSGIYSTDNIVRTLSAVEFFLAKLTHGLIPNSGMAFHSINEMEITT